MKVLVDRDLLVTILKNAIDDANEIAQQYEWGAKQGYKKHKNRFEEYFNSATRAERLLEEVKSESNVYGFRPLTEICKPDNGETCVFRHKRHQHHKRWAGVYMGKFSGKLNGSMYVEWMSLMEDRV